MLQVVINTFFLSTIYALLGLSFQYIFRTVHFFHLSHAIFISIVGYFVFSLSSLMYLPLSISIVFSLIISIAINLVIYRIYTPLLNEKAANWQLLVVSLGIHIILENCISLCWGDETKSFRNWQIEEGYNLFGAYITNIQVIALIVCISLISISEIFLNRNRIGKKIKAISANSELGQIIGISKEKVTVLSFIIGTLFASIAGILIAADVNMTPTMGFSWLLYGVVAMIIGGIGKTYHLLFGAILLASSQHLSAYYIGSKWMNAVTFIILILFLAWRPYGLSNKKIKKVEI